MEPEELKETGQRLFHAGQYSNALPLLKSAVDAFPEDESLWMTAHNLCSNGDKDTTKKKSSQQSIVSAAP